MNSPVRTPKIVRLLTLPAGMWCLLQLPVVHYHLFGLVDVELGGFVVITPTHWPLENSLKSTSLTVSGEEVGLGFFSALKPFFLQEVKDPGARRGAKPEACDFRAVFTNALMP